MITFNLPKAVYDTCFDDTAQQEYACILCAPDVPFTLRCKVDRMCFDLAYGELVDE